MINLLRGELRQIERRLDELKDYSDPEQRKEELDNGKNESKDERDF